MMEVSNQQLDLVQKPMIIELQPTVEIMELRADESNHSNDSSLSDFSKSQTKYIIGSPTTRSKRKTRNSPRSPRKSPSSSSPSKSPRRKLKKTKSLSKKLRASMGPALDTFLETPDSASDDNLRVVISQLVKDLDEKEIAIRLLQDQLAKTNQAVLRLQENMKELQARQLKTRDTTMVVVSEEEEIPEIIPPSVENSPVVERQHKESVNTELIIGDLPERLNGFESPSKSDRKKRRKRSSRGGSKSSGSGKDSKRSKRKSSRNTKIADPADLDPARLRRVFQKRTKKLIAAHNFFMATALKIYEARQNVDKKSFEESTHKLDDAILKHQIVEKLEDIRSRRQQQQQQEEQESSMPSPSKSTLVTSTTSSNNNVVPNAKQLRWKDDESLHEVHLVEPLCDKSSRQNFFYTSEEIRLFRFDKFMDDNAKEFDLEVIDSEDESYDEEIIEDEEDLDEDASLVSYASQVTLD